MSWSQSIHRRLKPENPIGKPLVLIWGPGEKDQSKLSKKVYNQLFKLRSKLKARLQSVVGSKIAIETSEDLYKNYPQLHSGVDGDIAVPESYHVKWSSIIICLDYPAKHMTLHSEYGLIYDYARDLLEDGRGLPQGRILVVMPEAYHIQVYMPPETPAVQMITTSGSVGHFLVKRVYELVQARLQEEWIIFHPYDDKLFDSDELLEELVGLVQDYAEQLQD